MDKRHKELLFEKRMPVKTFCPKVWARQEPLSGLEEPPAEGPGIARASNMERKLFPRVSTAARSTVHAVHLRPDGRCH